MRWILLATAFLWGLHRLALWLEAHGWLYYRNSKRRSRPSLVLAATLDPNARRILELQRTSAPPSATPASDRGPRGDRRRR